MNILSQKISYVLTIVVSTLLITYLHYSTGLEAHALHGIYAELYYIPILLGAFLGFKAAVITYLAVSALYLPFVILSWSQSLFLADKILHLLFTGVFAFLAGYFIDKEKRYRGQLEKDKVELQKLDELKSAFLTNVSHELRTPMTAITGYTDLLLDKVDGPINEEQEKSLKKISSHSKHLLHLINDILDVSRMESGEKIQLQRIEVDIRLVIESVATNMKPLIKQKGLTLNINVDENLPPVYADEERARQILLNLISNAIKFTHEGGITIRAHTSQRGIQEGTTPLFIEICIEDTGIGIKEENIKKLFDKFSQVDPSIKRQYEGTGLGLNLVKKLVELHEGEIWVTSTNGKGSVFFFTLPISSKQ